MTSRKRRTGQSHRLLSVDSRRLAHDVGPPAAAQATAMRPTALRADVYAGTERPDRNEREHELHLASFPST